MVPPPNEYELRPLYRLLHKPSVFCTDRVRNVEQHPPIRCAVRKEIHNFQASESPGAAEPCASTGGWVVSHLVGGTWVKHHKGYRWCTHIPTTPEPVAILPTPIEHGSSSQMFRSQFLPPRVPFCPYSMFLSEGEVFRDRDMDNRLTRS